MFSSRGVQYVHCVMHKCIMVKVGRGIWESRGNERFGGNRGNWGERTKIGGNFKFVTKKGHKNLEIFQRSLRNFSEIGGKILNKGRCIMASGGWTPLFSPFLKFLCRYSRIRKNVVLALPDSVHGGFCPFCQNTSVTSES